MLANLFTQTAIFNTGCITLVGEKFCKERNLVVLS
jgi:hypothetical protein